MNCLDCVGWRDGSLCGMQSNVLFPKLKTFGFAIMIIMGIGGLVVAGVGLGGYLQVGALSNLGQIKSIIMMVTGSGGGVVFLAIGIFCLVKKQSVKQPRDFIDIVSTINKIDINGVCAESFPCQHSFTVTFKNGNTKDCYADGRYIYKLLQQLDDTVVISGANTNHFDKYAQTLLPL